MELIIALVILFVKYNNADVCKTNPAEVEYYEQLITTNVLKSLSYKPPTNADEYRPKSDVVTEFGKFDFIVVGGGTAGSVIANRLSEIKEWNILLLEAGDDLNEFGVIPGVIQYIMNSKYNWNFISTVQNKSCLGSPDGRCSIIRGKALGGSSAINGLNYIRGNKETFNKWERDGNSGWSYKNVLPYFIKSENCQVDGDPDYHGKGGYWNVRNIYGTNIQFLTFMEANQNEFNYTSVDTNGKCQLGMFVIQANQIRGQRQSTARAFLTPFEKRKNLFILRRAYVTKVLIENKIAYGVEFSHNGTLFHASATKEVILSAGGIQSPQLLMLSGIGSKQELEKLNISVIKDLPVGGNILEPVSFSGLCVLTNYTAPTQTLKEMIEEYIQHKGELTISNSLHGIAFYQSSYVSTPGLPDIRLSIGQSSSVSEVFQKITNASAEEVDPRMSFNIIVESVNPVSVGSIKLATKDPYTYPLIDPNFFSNEQDLEVLYDGVQIVRRLVESPVMKTINASMCYSNKIPECEKYDETSKDFWFCAFRYKMSGSAFQGMGSCRMGCNSNTSVVNNKLQVHGISKLRVADGSIIPVSTPGITGTIVMIAEKTSDIIKRHYNACIKPITNVFGYNN